uniref:Xrn1 N-terminal domain-containing protein n=1 Tax=viral metagenome TaxID=1070528 RepID=A0A6C0LYF6_9ZZZZ
MGVPRLFKYISDRHPTHIRRFEKGTYTCNVDYMYIDSNAILHNVAQRVWNYGQHKRVLYAYTPFGKLTKEQKTIRTYEMYFEEIVELTKIVVPTKVLYIAIDGVAPAGKICQQRERRFQAASKNAGTDFNSNVISPGTVFESNLTNYMYYAIRKEMSTNPAWKDLEVIFSPPTVPGEGEHKILDYIRSIDKPIRNRSTHCMYGPDGDLIMLTLATHCPHFLLLKEDAFDPQCVMYYILNMGRIGRDLTRDMNGSATAIDDFILIGFFVGNDFLPKVQMFHMLENGLDTMIGVYNSLGLPLSNGSGEVIMDNFHRFVIRVASFEIAELERQATVNVRDTRFVNRTLLRHMTHGRVNLKTYADAYYDKARVTDPAGVLHSGVKEMCHSYVRMMVWVFMYYTKGCPSFMDYYPYYYAPLMTDLARTTFSHVNISFDHADPLTPFQQLLCVLPANDRSLLPSPYHKLMIRSSPIFEFYPSTFDIDYEGKLQEYQGVALLPFIDIPKVVECYNSVKTVYTYKRNTLGRVRTFKRDDRTTECRRYTSAYGTIHDCRIHARS